MFQRLVQFPETRLRRRISTVGFTREALLVLVLGALGSIGPGYVSWQTLEAHDNPPSYFEFELIAETISPLFLLFGLWLLYALCGHFLAKLYNGGRPFVRVFRVSAWALIPIGIWYLIRSVVIVALFAGMEFPGDPEGVAADEQVENVMALGLEDPVYIGTLLAGLVFIAWSWHLLSIGIAEAKQIGLEEAKKVAAVPAGLAALYIVTLVLRWQTFL